MEQLPLYLSKEKRENPSPAAPGMNGAVWGSIPFYPPQNSRASRVPEGILTPEMSATRWIGTSFLLCSPFPFLMALEKRGSVGISSCRSGKGRSHPGHGVRAFHG